MIEYKVFRHTVALLAVSICLAASAPDLRAQQTEGEVAEAAEGEEESHRNWLELFLGGASETAEGNTGFAIGAAYLRHLSERWVVGVLAELTFGGQRPRDFVLAVPVVLYFNRLGLILAPGFELKPPGAGGEGEESGSEEETLEALLRLGVTYEFEVAGYSLAPEFNVDIVNFDEVVLVYGVAFGVGF